MATFESNKGLPIPIHENYFSHTAGLVSLIKLQMTVIIDKKIYNAHLE
jgi:hypothetical protein